MLSIVSAYPIPFILAVLIGIGTAWWIWGRVEREEAPEIDTSGAYDGDDVIYAGDASDAAGPAAVPVSAAAGAGLAGAAIPAEPSPAAPAGRPNIAAAVGEPDDLKKIKGVGNKLEGLLNSLGVSRFDQIAAWDEREIAEVDQYLENFRGRIKRDDWVAQAKILAAGGSTEFSERY